MACASAVCSVSASSAVAAASRRSSLVSSPSSRVRFQVPMAAPSVAPLRRFSRVVAMSSDSDKPVIVQAAENLVDKIKQSITSAQEVCEGNETSEECVVAWDEVEELSAAASHKRSSTASSNSKDPLEKYCEDNPETDECRVYED